jgi:hypothetical protein
MVVAADTAASTELDPIERDDSVATIAKELDQSRPNSYKRPFLHLDSFEENFYRAP